MNNKDNHYNKNKKLNKNKIIKKNNKKIDRGSKLLKQENTSSTLTFVKNSGIITDNEYEVKNEIE